MPITFKGQSTKRTDEEYAKLYGAIHHAAYEAGKALSVPSMPKMLDDGRVLWKERPCPGTAWITSPDPNWNHWLRKNKLITTPYVKGGHDTLPVLNLGFNGDRQRTYAQCFVKLLRQHGITAYAHYSAG